MNCSTARKLFTDSRCNTDLERHLEKCRGCRDFVTRMEAVRDGLRRHHAGATPDPGFARRVRGRLKRDEPVELLGWAAVRLLPVSLAIALMLAWVAWERGSMPVIDPTDSEVVMDETDDPIEWLFAAVEDEP